MTKTKTNTIAWTILSAVIISIILLIVLWMPISTHGTKDILQSLHDPGEEWTLEDSDTQTDSLLFPQGVYHATNTYVSHDAVIDKEHFKKYANNIYHNVENVTNDIDDTILCYPAVNLSDNVCEGHFNTSIPYKFLPGNIHRDRTVYVSLYPDTNDVGKQFFIVSVGEQWTPEKDKLRH